ncbi:glycosyltransferase [Maribacter sp. HTCC2170]|uniref:glycosyltransferase n=1 Tax=Maribacter sp. (strain HTCC2170 / KCCM 42371) TaxID=313603 RepID=UPI00006AFCEC|nr:glycosyltransferase [Maribacter sp. HTCC2170]EAR01301.1 putative glycosyltransferase [Maribacter sp. HTCC2170]
MQIKSLLIIGYTWPEPTTTAAGNRMLQLIRFFKERGFKITFASTAGPSEYSLDLEVEGIQSESIELNNSSFNDFVIGLNPDAILFDRYLTEEQFGWRVAESVPNALRMLDTEDLHSLRLVREKCFKSGQKFTAELWLQDDLTKREIAAIYRSDLSLIISTYEMQLLTEVLHLDERFLVHLPFQLKELTADEQNSWPPFTNRNNFICIGNGKHAPNIDAIKWLKKEIWPLIRKALPKAELHVYGAYLPEHIQQMHKPSAGFLVKGWAKNVQEVMQNGRVNLAPLRFGAGIKGKLVSAMQCGTPSVTTGIGAEGMHGELPWNGSIEDSAEAIATAAIDLYLNEEKWYTAQTNGIDIINTFYDERQLNDRLLNKIETIQNNPENHRNQNFIGSLLLHQTMASTKYMSKWIEEKNKK